MNDKLLFENYLLVLKSTIEVYVHGTQESSNSMIHNEIKKSLNMILDYQNATYNLMQNNGWYQVDNISTFKIKKSLSKLNNS